jgi:hypothetical protein
MLIEAEKNKAVEGPSPDQVVSMEQEMDALQQELKLVEESHGDEIFNLVLARGYLPKLFGNAHVVRYLTQHYPDILHELQAVSEAALPGTAAAPNASS